MGPAHNRDTGRLQRAVRGLLATAWSLLRQLFHELSGLLFLVLAGIGVLASAREWMVYRQAGDLFRPLVATSFALLMLWFGVTSLLRARRILRERNAASGPRGA